MSTIIKLDLKELRRLVNDRNSCVEEKKVKQKLALQPWCLGNLKESVKKVLDYKVGKFDKDHHGILLSYKNLRVLQNVGAIHNDNSDIYFETLADYFIFKPTLGATLRGVVNKKSITHLGVLVHRVFNVVIPRPTEEPGAKWLGHGVQEGQEVLFTVVVLDLFGALPYIRGQLDERSMINAEADDVVYDTRQQNYVNFERTKPSYAQKLYHTDSMQMTINKNTILKNTAQNSSDTTLNDKSRNSPDKLKGKRPGKQQHEFNDTVQKSSKKSKKEF